MSQTQRILEYLSDGQEHEMRDVHRAVGFCRLNSRVSELRKRGHRIECRKAGGEYFYRMLAEPGVAESRADGSGHDTDEGRSALASRSIDVPGSASISESVPLRLFEAA
jgi:hypothetical protein